MFKNIFSFNGRIRRTEYGISFIIYLFCYLIIFLSSVGANGAKIAVLAYIPLIWFLWAQGAKRCHDVGNSGWFQIIPLYFFWLLFQDGDVGENQYGDNPKELGSFDPDQYESPFPDKPTTKDSYSHPEENED
jgi:uncharacterized membrane protein YhaH (DUF805 family)